MKKAIYAFSGDPITFGHIDIIERASRNFDEVYIGIGSNPSKEYMFSVEERTTMAKRSLEGMENVKVHLVQGLLVDFAYEHNIRVIVKGVRNTEDFNYENMLHQVGESQKLGIDTFILIARPELAHISSSAVKAILKEQGYIHEYVPLYVKQCLEIKMSKQYIIGVTGEIGVGKSYISKAISSFSESLNIPIHNVELDHLGHQILEQLTEPKYEEIRNRLVEYISKDPVVVAVFEGIGCVRKIRKLCGSTEPLEAEPGTIRGDFCHQTYDFSNAAGLVIRNVVHASASAEEAQREIAVWFQESEIHSYRRADQEEHQFL